MAVRLAPGAAEGPVIDQLNRLLAPFGGIDAHGRDQHMSHMVLNSEIKQQRVLGTVLPSIFLAVAVFLLNVVLSRQIATQREQIAALKALGYDNAAIGLHDMKLVMAIVLLGVLLGLGLGALLGHWFVGVYADVFRFPELRYRLKPELILAAVGLTTLAAVLATLNAIRASVRLAPAEAMRPPSPGLYKPMLMERLGLGHWLSPALRRVVRTMERRPLRTGLTIFGMAVAMAIVVTGAFWRDAIVVLMDTQFNQVLRGDVSLALVEVSPARVLHEVAKHATCFNSGGRQNRAGPAGQCPPCMAWRTHASHAPHDGFVGLDARAHHVHERQGALAQADGLKVWCGPVLGLGLVDGISLQGFFLCNGRLQRRQRGRHLLRQQNALNTGV